MGTSSFNLKDFWQQHGRNIKRYGLFLLVVIAGARTHDFLTAWIGVAGMLCLYGYDRWGARYEQAGKELLYPATVAKEKAERARQEDQQAPNHEPPP